MKTLPQDIAALETQLEPNEIGLLDQGYQIGHSSPARNQIEKSRLGICHAIKRFTIAGSAKIQVPLIHGRNAHRLYHFGFSDSQTGA
jgi:hypothetical protein